LEPTEQEQKLSNYDVVIKRIGEVKVASIRDVVPTPPEQGRLWDELDTYLTKQRIQTLGPCLTLYFDEEPRERDWDVEVCWPIEGAGRAAGRVKVQTLPAVQKMACVVHHGPFQTIGDAYDALMKWIDANGYRVCGPAREVYVRQAQHQDQQPAVKVSQTDPDAVTEVQFPVEKVE
jgi:effector-binding domain-containing protein